MTRSLRVVTGEQAVPTRGRYFDKMFRRRSFVWSLRLFTSLFIVLYQRVSACSHQFSKTNSRPSDSGFVVITPTVPMPAV